MKKIITYILFTLSCLFTNAASVDFSVKVSSSTVEVGQRVQVTFTINSSGGNFTPPAFQNFRMLSGPNQSSSMQYINGNVSRTTSISYILQAVEKGSFAIGPASIDVNGEVFTTKEVEINVVDASQNSANAQRNRQAERKAGGDELSDMVFMKALIDKRKAYVGEKVVVTYKLYSRLPLTNIYFDSEPAFSGFWKHEIPVEVSQANMQREQVNGEVYSTYVVKQSLLYPQRSGKLTIDPLDLKVVAQVQSSKRARSIFDQMFGGYEQKEIIATSNAINLESTALPLAGKPTGFSGAVGNFDMKLTSSKDSVVANQALDIKVEIKGTGNLPLIGAPTLNFPADFEVYDPETSDNFSTNYNGSKGSKSYKFLVIPRHSGEFNIEPYRFSYFDLASQRYKTIESQPLTISVSKGKDEEVVSYSPTRKEEVELLNTDIRFIHLNDLMLVAPSGLFYGSSLFYGLIVLALLLVALAFFLARKLKSRSADKVGLRKSKATKLAKKRLAKAKQHLDKNDKRSFYEEISAALYGYFADKFNISIAELSQEKIISLIQESYNNEGVIAEIKVVLEQAEMARFAPDSTINAPELYEKAVSIITTTENLKS